MKPTEIIERARKKNNAFLDRLIKNNASTENVKCKELTNNSLKETEVKEKNINDIPSEILDKIFSFLPLTSFAGEDKIQKVCKHWNNIAKGSLPSFDKAEITKSAKKLDDALLILKEDEFLKSLSMLDMLKIVAQHPVIIKKYLSENKLLQQSDLRSFCFPNIIDFEDTEVLELNIFINVLSGSHRVSVPFDKDKCFFLHPKTLISLGLSNQEIAQHIIKTSTLQSRKVELLALAKCAETAWCFLDNPTLCNSLIGKDLVRLGEQDLAIAKRIMNDPDLYRRLNNYDLAELGSMYSEIANQILNDTPLRNTLSVKALAKLGENNLDIAERIMDEFPAERIEACVLEALGKHHVNIAWKIIKDEKLCNKLSADRLTSLGKNMEIAMSILTTPALCKKLSREDLKKLVEQCKHVDVAWYILKTPELCDKLTGYSLVKLARDCSNLDLTAHILTTHCDKLNGNNLSELGVQHCAIAQAIFENPTLCEKLEPSHIVELFKSHPKIAAYILKDDGLRNKFNAGTPYDYFDRIQYAPLHYFFYLLENKNEDLLTYSEINDSRQIFFAPIATPNGAKFCELFSGLIYKIKKIANDLHQEAKKTNVIAHSENTESHERRLKK